MVDFVDVFVERAPVECTVGPVVPSILQYEEDGNLICHGKERRERYAGGEPAVLGHWVKEPDMLSWRFNARGSHSHTRSGVIQQ